MGGSAPGVPDLGLCGVVKYLYLHTTIVRGTCQLRTGSFLDNLLLVLVLVLQLATRHTSHSTA